jgi:hypothetical protein
MFKTRDTRRSFLSQNTTYTANDSSLATAESNISDNGPILLMESSEMREMVAESSTIQNEAPVQKTLTGPDDSIAVSDDESYSPGQAATSKDVNQSEHLPPSCERLEAELPSEGSAYLYDDSYDCATGLSKYSKIQGLNEVDCGTDFHDDELERCRNKDELVQESPIGIRPEGNNEFHQPRSENPDPAPPLTSSQVSGKTSDAVKQDVDLEEWENRGQLNHSKGFQ